MVPPHEVQEPVRQEHRELGDEVAFPGFCLAAGRRDADDDVPEQTVGQVAELALVLREREDVSRAILPAIEAIEFLYLIVAREENRKLAVFHLNRLEHGPRAAGHVGPRDPGVGPVLDDESHGHGGGVSSIPRMKGEICEAPWLAVAAASLAIAALRPGPGRCKAEGVGPACVIVPALDAASTVGAVVDDVRAALALPVIVVDDGSVDATADVARAHGAQSSSGTSAIEARAPRSGRASGKPSGGAGRSRSPSTQTGSIPAASARIVLDGSDDPRALVLGVSDLVRDGAPASNRFGNGVSNYFLSLFAQRTLRDTQCGLRRYPVAETLGLAARARGFAFEGEVVLRALAAGLPVVEVPISVVYSPAGHQGSHFRRVLNPTRIVATVVRTVFELRLGGS